MRNLLTRVGGKREINSKDLCEAKKVEIKRSEVDTTLKEVLPSPNDGAESVAENKVTVSKINSDHEDDCVPGVNLTVPRDTRTVYRGG